MKGCVLHDDDQSELFNIKTGVKQGCIIAPTLFSKFLATFLSQANIDLAKGVDIKYRTDGGVFKLSRKHYLPYADDCAVVAHSAQYLQNTLDALVDANRHFELSANAAKTKVIHQPAQSSATTPQLNTSIIERTALDNVDRFEFHSNYFMPKLTSIN